jgi:putative inorganic carbon (HCO3(-)) transporter
MDSEERYDHYVAKNLDRRRVFEKQPLSLPLAIFIGLVLGIAVLLIGALPYKWIFIISLAVCFPLFARAIGSVKRALEALLILSFGMLVDLNIGFTEKYFDRIWGTPITLTFILLVCLYALWAYRVLNHREKVNLFPVITLPLLIIVVWSGVSAYWAAKPDYTIYNLWGMVEMFLLLLYAANFMKSESDISFILKCIAVTIGVNGTVAIVQHFTGSFPGLEFLGTATREEIENAQTFASVGIFRASGFLDNANSFAWFLKVWLPLLFLWAVGGTGRISRYMCTVSFVLGLIALVLTFSRGGWIAFVFSLAVISVWLAKSRPHPIFRKIGLYSIFLGIAGLLVILPLLPSVLNRLTHDDYGAAHSRIPMAQVALNVIRDNPLSGVGMGNYVYVAYKYDNTFENISTEFPHPVHNIYLLLAAELGIGALGLFVFVSIVVYLRGVRLLRYRNAAMALFILGLIGGLSAFYLHGMVEQGIIGSWKFRPLWFINGIILACSKIRDDIWT